MINDVLSAIVTAIYDKFGCEVYKERIEQGLNEPCFFVQSISPTSIVTISNRRRREYQYAITYFPADNGAYTAFNDVIEELLEVLELIDVNGSKVRGKDVSAVVNDGVLVFTITYDFFTITPPIDETMNSYTMI